MLTGLLRKKMFHVRQTQPDDVPQMLQEYRKYLDTGISEDRIRFLVSNFPSYCIIHESGNIIGFTYCGRSTPDILELCNIFVAQSYQCMGLGTELLKRTLLGAKEAGYLAVILSNSRLYHTKTKKPDPTNFYLRLGFSEVFSTTGSKIFAAHLYEIESINSSLGKAYDCLIEA